MRAGGTAAAVRRLVRDRQEGRMAKSADAFRTISEVADELDVPKHVLRFWELRFPQIKPMKRGGGRRYYRPADVELLKGIRHLLHAEGYTIKGVQKILREHGVDGVKSALLRSQAAATPAPLPPDRPRKKRAGKGENVPARAPLTPQERRELLAKLAAELKDCRRILTQAGAGPTSPGRGRGKRKASS